MGLPRLRPLPGILLAVTVLAELGAVVLSWGLEPAWDTLLWALSASLTVGTGALILSRGQGRKGARTDPSVSAGTHCGCGLAPMPARRRPRPVNCLDRHPSPKEALPVVMQQLSATRTQRRTLTRAREGRQLS